jgi:hypothetical protein
MLSYDRQSMTCSHSLTVSVKRETRMTCGLDAVLAIPPCVVSAVPHARLRCTSGHASTTTQRGARHGARAVMDTVRTLQVIMSWR